MDDMDLPSYDDYGDEEDIYEEEEEGDINHSIDIDLVVTSLENTNIFNIPFIEQNIINDSTI